MPVDPEYLHQYYASLSDEALLAIDREELVDTAKNCYDHELGQRELGSEDVPRTEGRHGVPMPPHHADGKAES